MPHNRQFLSICPKWHWVVAVVICATGIFSESNRAWSQESKTRGAPPTNEQIAAWIEQLESDSYATRQLAFQLLKPHAEIAIPAVERSIRSAEEDAASRLVRLLASWSAYPDDGYGRAAFAALQRIAQGGVAARSSQAQRSIEVIKLTQSEYASEYLRRLSAYIGYEASKLFLLNYRYETHYVLKLDEAFRGSIEDLDRVSWLSEVEVVRLIGPHIDGRWLEQIVKIPNLRMLQIRHTSITSEDLTILYALNRLEGLEILYTPIDDNAIEVLGSLPLWGQLRLFGTNMSAQGVEELKSQLEGSDIMFGRGGFLGVKSRQDPLRNAASLIVEDVTAGSGAQKAGLQSNDRILSIDGKKLNDFDELRAELAKHSPGDVVIIEYERLNDEQSLKDLKPVFEVHQAEVTLGEQP